MRHVFRDRGREERRRHGRDEDDDGIRRCGDGRGPQVSAAYSAYFGGRVSPESIRYAAGDLPLTLTKLQPFLSEKLWKTLSRKQYRFL